MHDFCGALLGDVRRIGQDPLLLGDLQEKIMEKDVRQPDSTDLHAAELGKRHDVDAGQDVSAVPPPGATLGQGMEAPPGAPGILIEDLLIGLPANICQPWLEDRHERGLADLAFGAIVDVAKGHTPADVVGAIRRVADAFREVIQVPWSAYRPGLLHGRQRSGDARPPDVRARRIEHASRRIRWHVTSPRCRQHSRLEGHFPLGLWRCALAAPISGCPGGRSAGSGAPSHPGWVMAARRFGGARTRLECDT